MNPLDFNETKKTDNGAEYSKVGPNQIKELLKQLLMFNNKSVENFRRSN